MAGLNESSGDDSLAQSGVYVGPRPFRTGEKLYCRDREAVQLISLLVSQRLVLLHSPSGAGKTSLIYAKLVPAMQKKRFEVPSRLDEELGTPQPIVIRLNREPQPTDPSGSNRYVLSVLSSLESRRPESDQRRTSLISPVSLDNYLRQEFPAASRRASDDRGEQGFRPLLLVFDQFEELLTLDPTDQPAKQEFIGELAEALQDHGRWALFAIRDDFLGTLEPYLPALPTRLAATYHLDLLKADSAAGAIVEPARSAGIEFEEGLVDKLIGELREVQMQQPDGTFETRSGPYVEPVQLQVVCQSLWKERADPRLIRHEDLEALGGGSGSGVDEVLATYYARNVAAAASAGGVSERLVRDWFDRHLVTSQGVRRPVLEGEALEFGLTRACLRALDNAFLIRRETLHGALWYELAHDRLVGPVQSNNRQWRAESLSTFQRQAELWANSGRPTDLLAAGTALQEAERWTQDHADEITDTEKDFLNASRKVATTRRRRRAMIAAFTAALTVLAAVAVALGIAAHLARRSARDQAELAISRAGQARAAEQRAEDARKQAEANLDRAERAVYASQIRLAQNAWDRFDGGQAWHHLNACQWDLRGWEHDYLYTQLTKGQQILRASHSQFTSIAFSPDGRRLAATGNDGSLWVWRTEDHQELIKPSEQRNQFLMHTNHVTKDNVVFDPGGRRLATIGSDTIVKVQDSETGGVHFTSKGTVMVRDAENGKVLHTLKGHTQSIYCIAFSPDGARLASSSSDKTIKIWDAENGQEIATLSGHTNGVSHVVFSPDGSKIASASLDGTVRVWDVDRGHCLLKIEGNQDGASQVAFSPRDVSSVDFSPDGRRLASAGWGKTIMIWDAENGQSIRTLRGHFDVVNRVVFGPNGRWLASASSDQTVRVWDAENGECLITLPGHTAAVCSVVFSPDGRGIASASLDHTVRLWELQEVCPTILAPEEREIPAKILGRSLDLSRVVSADSEGTVRVRDVKEGREMVTLKGQTAGLQRVMFSPDNRRLLCFFSDETVKVWDAAEGHELFTPEGSGAKVCNHAFSPDSLRLALARRDRTVAVWDMRDGRWLFALPARTVEIFPLVFSPDGCRLVTTALDSTVRVSDATNGQLLFTLAGVGGVTHANRIDTSDAEPFGPPGPEFAPENSGLPPGAFQNGFGDPFGAPDAENGELTPSATGADPFDAPEVKNNGVPQDSGATRDPFGSGGAAVGEPFGPAASDAEDEGVPPDPFGAQAADATNSENGELPPMVPDIFGSVTIEEYMVMNAVFSPDGRWVAGIRGSNTVVVWDAESGECYWTLISLEYVRRVVFGPNSRRIASIQGTTGGSNTVTVWDLQKRQKMYVLRGHAKSVWGVVFSPDGRRLVTASEDGTVKLWNADYGTDLITLRGYKDFSFLRFSPDGRRLVARDLRGNVSIWEAAKRQHTFTLQEGTEPVASVAFSPDGERLVSGGGHRIRVWDTQQGNCVFTAQGHREGLGINSVSFSPDGRRLASAGNDATAKVWDAANGSETLSLEGHRGGVTSAIFSPDGRRLASGGWDKTVKLWDAEDGKLLRTLEGHAYRVNSVAFSPDGRRLASASWDQTARVWDVENGKPLLTLEGHNDCVTSVAFRPAGRQIATASRDGTVKLWDGETGQELLKLQGSFKVVTGIAFSPDGRQLAGATSNSVKVWNVGNGMELITLRETAFKPNSVAFSPDGRRLVSGGGLFTGGTITMWRIAEMLAERGHDVERASEKSEPGDE